MSDNDAAVALNKVRQALFQSIADAFKLWLTLVIILSNKLIPRKDWNYVAAAQAFARPNAYHFSMTNKMENPHGPIACRIRPRRQARRNYRPNRILRS
ncbi:hypothetical protein [Nitrosomonas sp. Is37]|uniref:hypothetical protein n=1 Tax=Nitrosomonas sp. Is37 TaxID=3080535 RepID=UPI00294AA90F|nr:hypothetical protein [Nitrosomonas sp. Is37]MDV6343404.1 hypothetical protein [Nitrosomonas sp. Is37]